MKRTKMKKGYDTEMIEDFLEHYLWETRASLFEQGNAKGINPELVEQLAKYIKKYGPVGFSPYTILEREEDLSDEDHALADRILRARTHARASPSSALSKRHGRTSSPRSAPFVHFRRRNVEATTPRLNT